MQRERGTWHLIPPGHGTLVSLWGPTLMTWSLPKDTPSPDTFLLEVRDCAVFTWAPHARLCPDAPSSRGRPVPVCFLTPSPHVGAPCTSVS